MVQKAEIIVEQFDNGIAIQWIGKDEKGNEIREKKIAIEGTENYNIGKLIWDDIFEFFDKKDASRVLITANYQSL